MTTLHVNGVPLKGFNITKPRHQRAQKLEDFLRRVLPAEHDDRVFIFDTGVPGGKPIKSHICDGIGEMADRILKADVGNEVWFSPAAYDRVKVEQSSKGGRVGANVAALKAIRQDIDINPTGTDGKRLCHTSVEAALASRDAVYKALGLSAALTVKSGGGLHSYIMSSREMTPAEYSAMAKAIAAKIEAADPLLAVDTKRWCDLNGLLRPPFTFNKKAAYGAPRLVEIVL